MQVWQKGKAKYIFFVFVFLFFRDQTRENKHFHRIVNGAIIITFIVTKFEKKKEGTKKAN